MPSRAVPPRAVPSSAAGAVCEGSSMRQRCSVRGWPVHSMTTHQLLCIVATGVVLIVTTAASAADLSPKSTAASTLTLAGVTVRVTCVAHTVQRCQPVCSAESEYQRRSPGQR